MIGDRCPDDAATDDDDLSALGQAARCGERVDAGGGKIAAKQLFGHRRDATHRRRYRMPTA